MRKSKEAARWDAWYEKQETTAAPQEIPQELTRLPSPLQTMLDVGCGTGEMVRFWAGRQVHATGLDISKNAIRRAVKLTPPLLSPFCQWTAEDWKMTSLTDRGWNSAFDLVYSSMGPDMTNMEIFVNSQLPAADTCVYWYLRMDTTLYCKISQKPFVETPLCHLHSTEPVKFSHC